MNRDASGLRTSFAVIAKTPYVPNTIFHFITINFHIRKTLSLGDLLKFVGVNKLRTSSHISVTTNHTPTFPNSKIALFPNPDQFPGPNKIPTHQSCPAKRSALSRIAALITPRLLLLRTRRTCCTPKTTTPLSSRRLAVGKENRILAQISF